MIYNKMGIQNKMKKIFKTVALFSLLFLNNSFVAQKKINRNAFEDYFEDCANL